MQWNVLTETYYIYLTMRLDFLPNSLSAKCPGGGGGGGPLKKMGKVLCVLRIFL
jgi:hypothetical protein